VEQKHLQQQFIEIYDELADTLFRHCSFRVSDKEIAMDIMQDAFTKTWDYVSKGNDVHDVRAFVYRVANNLIIDHYRKKKSSSLEALTEESETEKEFAVDRDTQERIYTDAELSHVAGYLEEMDDSYREVLVMRFIDGLSPKDIADIADITEEEPNTVSVRINRAVKQLKHIIEAYGK
tara:strand:+ start:297 stop:830 length:534 start_codon:yes stop_codon:yes gene_type:complete